MLEALEAESLPEEGWVYAGSSSVDLGPLASVRTVRAGVLTGGKSRVFVANKDAEPPVRPPPPPPNSVPCVARAQTLCPGRCAAPSASRGRRRSRGCRRRAQAAPRGVGFSVFSFTAVRPGNAIASFELRPDGARPPPRVCKAADRRARRCTCCTRAGARGAGC